MSPSPSVAPALAFPLPQSIAYSALGLSPKALGLVKAGARAMGETINTQQAFRVVRDTFGLGKDIRTGYGREAHGVLMEKFFPGFTTFTRTVDVVHPVQVQIKDEADGDTTKIWVEGYGNVSVRHDGIDTPESNPSEKLSKVVNYIFAYLQEEHAIPDSDMTAAKAVIQARVVYLGKLAGLVNKAFMGWSEFVSLAPAYARVAGAAHLCDVLDYADKYGRVLGRFMAGMPGEQNDLFDGFITSEVYNVMKAGGMAERETYRQKLGPHSGLLNSWKTQKPELYGLLSLDGAVDPSKIFSRDECHRIATAWQAFVAQNPKAKNDLQTLFAFMGIAPPYPKYRGSHTMLDLSAEQFALGRVTGITNKAGLTIDPVYMFMRPFTEGLDASPVFLRFPYEMSGGKELHPKDCCDEFGCPV